MSDKGIAKLRAQVQTICKDIAPMSQPSEWKRLFDGQAKLRAKSFAASLTLELPDTMHRFFSLVANDVAGKKTSALLSAAWKETVYAAVSKLRGCPDGIPSAIHDAVLAFLLSASSDYERLGIEFACKLPKHHVLDLPRICMREDQLVLRGHAFQIYVGGRGAATHERQAVLLLYHSTLLARGDIQRYLQGFGLRAHSDALLFYRAARKVAPASGKPYNCIASVYAQSMPFEAYYMYIRALAVKTPIETARDVILSLLEGYRRKGLASLPNYLPLPAASSEGVADSSVIWLKPGTDLAQAFSTTRGSHVQMSSVLAADMSEPELRRDFIRLAMCQQAAVYSHTGLEQLGKLESALLAAQSLLVHKTHGVYGLKSGHVLKLVLASIWHVVNFINRSSSTSDAEMKRAVLIHARAAFHAFCGLSRAVCGFAIAALKNILNDFTTEDSAEQYINLDTALQASDGLAGVLAISLWLQTQRLEGLVLEQSSMYHSVHAPLETGARLAALLLTMLQHSHVLVQSSTAADAIVDNNDESSPESSRNVHVQAEDDNEEEDIRALFGRTRGGSDSESDSDDDISDTDTEVGTDASDETVFGDEEDDDMSRDWEQETANINLQQLAEHLDTESEREKERAKERARDGSSGSDQENGLLAQARAVTSILPEMASLRGFVPLKAAVKALPRADKLRGNASRMGLVAIYARCCAAVRGVAQLPPLQPVEEQPRKKAHTLAQRQQQQEEEEKQKQKQDKASSSGKTLSRTELLAAVNAEELVMDPATGMCLPASMLTSAVSSQHQDESDPVHDASDTQSQSEVEGDHESDHEGDDDIRALALAKLSLESQLQQAGAADTQQDGDVTDPEQVTVIVRPTTAVLDTNSLLNPKSFDHIEVLLDNKIEVLVPQIVLGELSGIAAGDADDEHEHSDELRHVAAQALTHINAQIQSQSSVYALTAAGSVLSDTSLYREAGTRDKGMTNDDVVLQSAKQHAIKIETEDVVDVEGRQCVLRKLVLLTGDRNLRLRAHVQDIVTKEMKAFVHWIDKT